MNEKELVCSMKRFLALCFRFSDTWRDSSNYNNLIVVLHLTARFQTERQSRQPSFMTVNLNRGEAEKVYNNILVNEVRVRFFKTTMYNVRTL